MPFTEMTMISNRVRLLCRWNIECPNDQMMYFDIAEHDLEPQVESEFFSVSQHCMHAIGNNCGLDLRP